MEHGFRTDIAHLRIRMTRIEGTESGNVHIELCMNRL